MRVGTMHLLTVSRLSRVLRNKPQNLAGKLTTRPKSSQNISVPNSSASGCSKWIYKSPYTDVHIPTDKTFTQYVFDKQDKYGHKKALINGETGQTFSHLEVRLFSMKLASAFSRLDFGPGDFVAIVSPNCPEFTFVFFGLIVAGATPTTVNFSFTAEEIGLQLSNAKCVGVICHIEKLSVIKESCKNNPDVRHIICIGGESEGVLSLHKLLEDDGKGLSSHIEVNPSEDILVMPYSSGTTGLPKGVMLTHNNVVANLQQFTHPDVCIIDPSLEAKEIILGVVPQYHIYGMVINMAYAMCLGATLLTMKEFEQKAFVRHLKQHKPTVLPMVPPLISFLEGSKDVSPSMLNSTHSIVCGAAPLGDTVLQKFLRKFGRNIRFIEGYGLTETSPVALASRKDNFVVGSCGVPIPNTLAKIIDVQTGDTVGPNEGEGELCIKGPQVMKGYFKNEEATRSTIDEEGWLHTGDIARIDENHNVFILDRLKELIKVKGLQVAPAELENLLREHPGVEDVAVIGVPDERSGELPRAFVVASKDAKGTNEEELMAFVSQRVAKHKQIRSVVFIDEIPKSAAGKLLRKELKNRF